MANTSQELAAAAAGVTTEDLGEKVRVHALAKLLGIPSAEMITVLGEHGIGDKRATSTLPRAEAERVLGELTTAGEPAEAPEKKAPEKKAPAQQKRRRRATRKAGAPSQPVEPVDVQESPAVVPSTATTTAQPTSAQNALDDSAAQSPRRRRRTTRRSGAVATSTQDTADTPETPEPTQPATKKQSAPEPEPAGEDGEAREKDSGRPVVRRRVVRRVGSRSAAAGAEQLRREKELERQQEADESGDRNGSRENGDSGNGDNGSASSRRRRGSRGRGRGRGDQQRGDQQDAPEQDTPKQDARNDGNTDKADKPEVAVVDEPVKLKGSTRLESKRRWREEQGNQKHKSVTRAEFMARRENIYRSMVVRDAKRSDHPGRVTQVGVVEDGLLAEHFVTSETQTSTIGNIYLGRVQNVLASMEAAFVDIGTGRNAVLYASEVDWRSEHIRGRSRRIESALKQGDQVLVQVIKDPLGHKGARLTNRVSFAGRYLVYVPGGKTQGISRKLPEAERKRLKGILQRVVPENGGTIIRTAAEGVSEEKIAEDVDRLHRRWLDITGREEAQRDKKGSTPVVMYEEPNLLVKVVRDLFNEDFNELVVDGGKSWGMVHDYVHRMAPDLEDKLVKWNRDDHDGEDAFAAYELDDQLSNAKSRKVWLPSGGYLVIDRTEAMIVIDVNTGSFTGSGGNLEETVTKNNLEAAEEIVRQMRLRDMGGMIVVDFIDMVLEENRDLVLRRLTEFLASDRTRHKISEVTSLGLVQMTRKRLGAGLVETYSTECEACAGRGIIVHEDPVEHDEHDEDDDKSHKSGKGHRGRRGYQGQQDGADRDGLKQARHEQEIRRRYEQHAEPPTAEVAKVVHSAVQDTAESTESTEPAQSGEPAHSGSAATGASTVSGGGRRVRRRIVRRAADEEQDASRDAGDAGDDISSIAAHAVAHAGDVDPEEPTGADYVADEPDSAAAVETPDSGDEDTDAGADTDTGVTVRRSRDRRGRRVVRRVVETPEADRAPEAAAATGTDTPTDTGQESTPDPRAEFENARADFQRSPRRRRRVRGNSRSDVAPAPGDFGLQASQVPEEDPSPVQQSEQAVTAEPAGTPAPSTEQSSGAGDDQKSRHQENRRPRSGRRRRRKVVRSSS